MTKFFKESSPNTNDEEQQTLDSTIEEDHETPISSGNVVELASIRNRRLGIDAQLIRRGEIWILSKRSKQS